MDKKSKIIDSIFNLDIESLKILLNDNYTYNDVSKKLFLERLEKEFSKLKESGIERFEVTSKGKCNNCNKGCPGFSFITKNLNYLDLIFEESEDEITDITRCKDLINNNPTEKEHPIFLEFYEDERVGYKHSIDTQIILNNIEVLLDEYNQFKGEVLDISILYDWTLKANLVDNQIGLDERMTHKCFKPFLSVFLNIQNVMQIIENHHTCLIALKELKEVDFRSSDSKWEWIYKYTKLYTSLYRKFDELDNNFILIRDNITLDSRNFKESLEFKKLFKESIYRED